jgi:ribosome assembly protein 1
MMGRELEPVDQVPCGNIVAIGGLENLILKSATLSSTLYCPSFTDMYMQTTPIVRVAIEPKNPSKIKELVKGLKLLNQADLCVEILVQENGEHILCTAGEVHLQRCVDDLVNLFAKVEVNVSQPIIAFKETIVKSTASTNKGTHDTTTQSKTDQNNSVNNSISGGVNTSTTSNNSNPTTTNSGQQQQQHQIGPDGRIEACTNDKRLRICLRAKPLPCGVTQLLEENSSLIKLLSKLNQNKLATNANVTDVTKLLNEFKAKLVEKFAQAQSTDDYYAGRDFKDIVDKIVSFGPNRHGPNLLVNLDEEQQFSNIWSAAMESSSQTKGSQNDYENYLMFGFNLATAKGPLCEEPMQGVAFFIDKFEYFDDREAASVVTAEEKQLDENEDSGVVDETTSSREVEPVVGKVTTTKIKGQSMSSQCISLMNQACKRAFEAQPQRLMAAMYKCELMTVSSEALGKLYAVLGKRNAKILDETMKDNTNMFLIIAHIPVADSMDPYFEKFQQFQV